jgi:hypothetical protein
VGEGTACRAKHGIQGVGEINTRGQHRPHRMCQRWLALVCGSAKLWWKGRCEPLKRRRSGSEIRPVRPALSPTKWRRGPADDTSVDVRPDGEVQVKVRDEANVGADTHEADHCSQLSLAG